jgi:4-alpha-glucanotransferase
MRGLARRIGEPRGTEAAMMQLHALAQACGLARTWTDVEGRQQQVADAALTAICAALGHDAQTERQIARSLAEIAARNAELPPMLVVDVGAVTTLPIAASRAEITGEDGVTHSLAIDGTRLTITAAPGYYDLALAGRLLKLAVAPAQCPLPAPTARRPWGMSLQIPSLRGASPSAFGSFGELAEAARLIGYKGADALAINPVHALFPGYGGNFSPYSPSSRLFLNGAMGDPALVGLPPLPESEDGPLIDWEAALPRRLAELRAVLAALDPAQRERIAAAGAEGGAMLHRHALFDALDCHFRPQGAHGWRDWPAAFHDPQGPAAAAFAADHPEEIAFHLFLQWLAREGLNAVQTAARSAGMAVGLIGDLAVGVDPSGSDAWSLRDAMLDRLTIGAPPDPLGPLGQNWSITSFSPEGLRAAAYEPWIAMIRSAMTGCGGLRIDHAFGLARLWVIPEGAATGDGAYLSYPFEDLIRLATLEAHRAQALVIAEDLGTAPYDFTQAVTARQMLGMRVLWFERAADHGFIGAQDYEPLSAAMSGTHDTPTVAGWWRGRDLDWADKLGRLPEGISRAAAEDIRDWDRGLLWSTLSGEHPRPAPDDPQPVVDAAIAHIAHTPSQLAIIALEDMLGLEEQPNLPGTVAVHPNWRRRLDAPVNQLFDNEQFAQRCAILRTARERPESDQS